VTIYIIVNSELQLFNLIYYQSICLEGLRLTARILGQDGSHRLNSNGALLECKPEAFPLEPSALDATGGECFRVGVIACVLNNESGKTDIGWPFNLITGRGD
jgi:hypothetical protein